MNYYEELGLPPTADEESIRKSHRTLSKLLHPDQQTDPTIRRAAEIQMQRLNGVVAILLNPDRRRQYDETLARLRRPVGVLAPAFSRSKELWRNPGSGMALLATIGIAIALTVSALWIFAGDLMRFEANAEASQAAVVTRPAAPISPPVPVKPVIRRSSPLIAKPALAGLWVFAPSRSKFAPSRSKEEQAKEEPTGTPISIPEYAELKIRTADNNLTGEYIARYRMPDQPVSPFVQFAFEGRSSQGSGAFEWHSDDGSHGTVSLKPLGPASLRVEWLVTERGSSMGVDAGTAVLIRKTDQ